MAMYVLFKWQLYVGIDIVSSYNLQLEKRKERNKKEKQAERICNYKFWEPPSTLRKYMTVFNNSYKRYPIFQSSS